MYVSPVDLMRPLSCLPAHLPPNSCPQNLLASLAQRSPAQPHQAHTTLLGAMLRCDIMRLKCMYEKWKRMQSAELVAATA